MIFVVYIGVNDLKNSAAKDEAGKKAAIAIGDTVSVRYFFIENLNVAICNIKSCLAIMGDWSFPGFRLLPLFSWT